MPTRCVVVVWWAEAHEVERKATQDGWELWMQGDIECICHYLDLFNEAEQAKTYCKEHGLTALRAVACYAPWASKPITESEFFGPASTQSTPPWPALAWSYARWDEEVPLH